MSDERDVHGHGARGSEPDADLRRVLGALDRPAARPEFRAALRERFLAGADVEAPRDQRLDAVSPASRPASTPPRDASTPSSRAATPERRSAATPERRAAETPRSPRRLVLLAGALAAAAAIVLTLFLTRPRTALWRVHADSSATAVLVDGVALRMDDTARIGEALLTARELEVVSGTLRLCVREEAWIELAPGTKLSQMKFAAAGPYQLRTDRGSLAVATLPAFGGRGMRVLTDDLDLMVTGTIFGVDVDAQGSCICTLEGSVRCDAAGGQGPRPVESGRMCYAYRGRSEPTWKAAHEPHLKPLRDLRAAIE